MGASIFPCVSLHEFRKLLFSVLADDLTKFCRTIGIYNFSCALRYRPCRFFVHQFPNDFGDISFYFCWNNVIVIKKHIKATNAAGLFFSVIPKLKSMNVLLPIIEILPFMFNVILIVSVLHGITPKSRSGTTLSPFCKALPARSEKADWQPDIPTGTSCR